MTPEKAIVSGRQLRLGQEVAQQLGRAVLDEDFGLEVEPGREAQVLVRRPGVAVAAAVGAAAVGVDAVAEADVGAVVLGDDRLRLVGQILGRRPAELGQVLVIVGDVLEIGLAADGQIRIRGLDGGAAAFEGGNHRKQFLGTANTGSAELTP